MGGGPGWGNLLSGTTSAARRTAARGVAVRITGTGHASLFLETSAGSILCDPWVNPAYFASWFPFPDNSGLDWQRMGQCDFLYVSHLHRDHFDAKNLAENVRKDTTVLFPPFGPAAARRALRGLKMYGLLGAVRGRPALAVEAFCQMASRLSVLAIELADCIAEVDINPVRLMSDECIGLDALLVRTGSKE